MVHASTLPAAVEDPGATAPRTTPTIARSCKVSLIIPTRNESDSVPLLFEKLNEVLAATSHEVILVDDSDDDTPEVADRVAAELGLNASVIHRDGEDRRGGLSSAVLVGVAAACGEYVCVMDADLQHPPELIALMIATATEKEADIVVASRYVEGGTDAGLSGRARKMISLTSRGLTRTLFRGRLQTIRDPLSGFFLARRSLVIGTALRPIGFKILLDILVRSEWQIAEEVPLRFERRAVGSSKATLRQGRDFLAHVARLFWERRTGGIKHVEAVPRAGEVRAAQTRS